MVLIYGQPTETRRTDPPHFHGVPPTFAAEVLAAGLDRDRTAAARVRDFVTSAKFAVNQAAVPGTIPTEGRPDLYLDGLMSSTPVLDATMSPEGITDGAPQLVPQWASEGALAGAHIEGQAPGSGSFVVSGDTITPAPISGEVTISREVFDSKGSPRANELVWSRMRTAYLKVAEQRAASALAAATLTTVPAVGVNAALVDGLSSALFSLAMGEMTQDLTTLLLGTALSAPLEAARSTAGERLVPLIAGQPPRMGLGVREGTVAWSLAASYLMRPGALLSLVSAPRRLEFSKSAEGVQVAVWGYSAHTPVDPTGIRRITYAAS